MPVKKGKGKSKKNIDSKVKKQIKETVEKLPRLIAEEMGEKNEQKYLPQYDESSYKRKKIMMWTIVAIFFLVILAMWIINVNSVFYDFTKNIKGGNNLDIKNKMEEIQTDDFQKLLNDFDAALEKQFGEEPEEKETVNLEDVINAVNNYTSTTTTTASNNQPATSTEDIASSTEEVVN